MPHGLPAASVVEISVRAHCFNPRSGKRHADEWVPKGRHLTLLGMAADQDGWNGEVMARHPAYADGRCLVLPRGALRL